MHRGKLLKQPKSSPSSTQHNETQTSKAGEKPTAELGTSQSCRGTTGLQTPRAESPSDHGQTQLLLDAQKEAAHIAVF